MITIEFTSQRPNYIISSSVYPSKAADNAAFDLSSSVLDNSLGSHPWLCDHVLLVVLDQVDILEG